MVEHATDKTYSWRTLSSGLVHARVPDKRHVQRHPNTLNQIPFSSGDSGALNAGADLQVLNLSLIIQDKPLHGKESAMAHKCPFSSVFIKTMVVHKTIQA